MESQNRQTRFEAIDARQMSMPALFDQRSLPLLASRQDFIICSADLGAQQLAFRSVQQPQLEAELMRINQTPHALSPAVLTQREEFCEFLWFTVPIGALEDLHGG